MRNFTEGSVVSLKHMSGIHKAAGFRADKAYRISRISLHNKKHMIELEGKTGIKFRPMQLKIVDETMMPEIEAVASLVEPMPVEASQSRSEAFSEAEVVLHHVVEENAAEGVSASLRAIKELAASSSAIVVLKDGVFSIEAYGLGFSNVPIDTLPTVLATLALAKAKTEQEH